MQNGFFISASNCASVQNGTDLTLSSNITPAEPMAAAYRSVPRPAATHMHTCVSYLLSTISCLLPSFSYILSPLLSLTSFLLYPVSSPLSCLLHPFSYLLTLVSWFLSPGSFHLAAVLSTGLTRCVSCVYLFVGPCVCVCVYVPF